MSRKYVGLIMVVILLGLLSGCKNNNSPEPNKVASVANQQESHTENVANNPATNSENPPKNNLASLTEKPKGENLKANIEEERKEKAAQRKEKAMEERAKLSTPNIKLADDVPVFPNSQEVGKLTNHQVKIFDYKTSNTRKEVEDFYKDSLKKNGWAKKDISANSRDGLLFIKGTRLLKVVAHKGKEGNEYHLLLSEPVDKSDAATSIVDEKTGQTRAYAGNVFNGLNKARYIPADVPKYPNAKDKPSEFVGQWWEYRSNDSVSSIASWYGTQLKNNGWGVELDTSELGDSMIIYNKTDEKGNHRYVGVRVNDRKEEKERWLTLILYPDNTTIPHVKSLSQLQAEQKDAAKVVADGIKQGNEAKEKALKEYQKNNPTPKK